VAAFRAAAACRLPDQPTRLLLFMAVATRDQDRPPVYFGGRDALAAALGESLPDAKGARAAAALGDPEPNRLREQAFRRVRRSLGDLDAAKLIHRSVVAAPGRRAEYELLLHEMEVSERPPYGGQSVTAISPEMEVSEWTERRSVSGQNGGHSVTPLLSTSSTSKEKSSSSPALPAELSLARPADRPAGRQAAISRSDSTTNREPPNGRAGNDDDEFSKAQEPEPPGARDVDCPWCEAKPRTGCSVPGTGKPLSRFHPARYEAAAGARAEAVEP
jgi:hypothetical protein